jgi:phosphatidylglycerophosphate synthase
MWVPSKYDWMFFQSVVLLIGSAVDFFWSKLFFCPLFGFFLFTGLLYKNWHNYTEISSWGGLPNLITVSRLLLLFALPFLDKAIHLGLLSLLVVSMDGLDGFAARKLNQTTEFGGILDMETDAFFCLLFSLTIAIQNPDLQWILIGGLLRYLYKITTTFIPKSGYTESKKKYARFIAGCYFISFIFYFFTIESIGVYCVSIGTGLVILSFTISFFEFLNHKEA